MKPSKTKSFKTNKKPNIGKSLYESKILCNIKFEVEGEIIRAHKVVLGLGCEYFNQLFTSKKEEFQGDKIIISDIKTDVFKAIIKYIYCQEIELTEDLAPEIIKIVDRFMLVELKRGCEDFQAKILLEKLRVYECSLVHS